jgi:hypothetical protein
VNAADKADFHLLRFFNRNKEDQRPYQVSGNAQWHFISRISFNQVSVKPEGIY